MKNRSTRERGMALLVALFFVGIAVILLTALGTRLVTQDKQISHYAAHEECVNGLEAAYNRVKLKIENGEDTRVGMDGWTYKAGTFPAFDATGVTPITSTVQPRIQYYGFAQNWMNDAIDNNGDGQVDNSKEAGCYTIYAAARDGGSVRRMEAVLQGKDVNVWRNAIFAGGGQVGGVIKGNVSIHGSVHILGNNLPAGGEAIAALDMSGTSLIHNNYADCPAALAARVPALATTTLGTETVGTLDANLRVKHGLVSLSGNSEVGQVDATGNAYKETMDGTFVNEGWTGNAVVDDGDRGDPKSVWSDNGWDELYDLGDRVPFPVLTDDWRSPVTGARVMNATTGTYYTHQDYFDQVLLADPAVKTDGVYTGTMDIYTKGSSFYWNATKNIKLTGSLPSTAPASTDDYIMFNVATETLQINGQITINGNLIVRGKGNSTTVNYSGRGAILVHGNVTLDCDLLTCNNATPTNTANSFPVNNCLGIMASDSMTVVRSRRTVCLRRSECSRATPFTWWLPTVARLAMRTYRSPCSSIIDIRTNRASSPGKAERTSSRNRALIS